MEFHDFMKQELKVVQDGVHKECRAKDPDNCRKCHTGRFSLEGDGGRKAANGKGRTEPWKVFKKGGKELFAYTVRGEGKEEETDTKKLLADENKCSPEDIDVVKEDRAAIKGAVPGSTGDEKEDIARIESILKSLAAKNDYYQIEDLEIISRPGGVFEIVGGMINADDGNDVDNALWGVRSELLKNGFREADWRVSGDFGFFFTCKKDDEGGKH